MKNVDNYFYQVCNLIYCHTQCTDYLCSGSKGRTWITCCSWGLLDCFYKILLTPPTAYLWFSNFYFWSISLYMDPKTFSIFCVYSVRPFVLLTLSAMEFPPPIENTVWVVFVIFFYTQLILYIHRSEKKTVYLFIQKQFSKIYKKKI